MAAPEDVLSYWLDEVGPEGWYKGGTALDNDVLSRFGDVWQGAMDGRYALWLTYPSGALAYIILMDQFPRNMFRDTPQSFGSDRYALAASKQAISRGWDLRIDEPARQFFYMPLMHSENLTDQDRCIRLMKERMLQTDDDNLLHARAHREVIRKFGRFPTRNAALSRHPTALERDYVANGGYGHTISELTAARG